jgi:hypothetical protein
MVIHLHPVQILSSPIPVQNLAVAKEEPCLFAHLAVVA